MAPDPVVPTDPEVPEVPVPDPADPVGGASTLFVDDVPEVPVALADAEWLGDAEWPGDDDPVDLTFGLAELLGVVVAVRDPLAQPLDGVVVTVCSTAGLGFSEVLVDFGVGVVLVVALGLAEVLALALGLALPLALTVLVGLAVLRAGLLE